MLVADDIPALSDEEIDSILRHSPIGAFVLAGISTLIVIAIWFIFFLLVFLPRGMLQ